MASACQSVQRNLHPTEGYVLLPSMDAIHDRPGVYHYASKAHGLELRADFDPSVWAALTAAFPEGSSSWGCRPFFGGRPGSMASVRSGTANTMSAMHWGRCDSRRQPSGGKSTSSAVWVAPPWPNFSDSTARPTTPARSGHPELVALVVREKSASDRGLCLSKEFGNPGGQFSVVRHS